MSREVINSQKRSLLSVARNSRTECLCKSKHKIQNGVLQNQGLKVLNIIFLSFVSL